MHYIIGERFVVTGVIRGSADPKILAKNRLMGQFPEPGEHELYYIRRKPEGDVEYTFVNLNTRNKHVINFKSTKEADKLLSTIIGEDLPDYEAIYIDLTD